MPDKDQVKQPENQPTSTELLDVIIVNPNEVYFEGQAKKVYAPGKISQLAFLPQHTPMFSELIQGEIQVETNKGEMKNFKIESGVAKVNNNLLSILISF